MLRKQFDLSRGAPPLDSVPVALLTGEQDGSPDPQELIKRNHDLLLYKGSDVGGQNFIGYGPLRETLAKKHGVGNRQIITAHGGMDAMSHVLTYVTKKRQESRNSGNTPNRPPAVATEIPTYDRFPANLSNRDMDWVGVPLTADGLDTNRLHELVKRRDIDLFYGIPEGQNPTAYTYPEDQRREVEEICAEEGIPVLWDAAYWNLTYGRSNPPIQNPPGNVIWQLNYTKEIAAGLKNGYLVVPQNMQGDFDHIIRNTRLNPVYPVQAWLNEIITSPEYPAHIQKLQEIFGKRAKAIIEAYKHHSPDVRFLTSEVDSGYFVEASYPGVKDHDAFLASLSQEGITAGDARNTYAPGYEDMANGKVRIPFAALNEKDIDEIVQTMQAVYERVAV